MNGQGDLQEMSPEARALLAETRSMDDPSGADHARVKRKMLGAIAAGSGLAASTATSSTAAAAGTGVAAAAVTAGGASLGIKVAAVVLVAGALGGSALVVTRAEEPARRTVAQSHEPAPVLVEPTLEEGPIEATPSPPLVVEPEPAIAEEPPVEEAPDVDTPALPAPRIARPAARAPPVAETAPAPSPLRAELSLLRSAQRAIAAHDGSTAMRHLDELARRFPDGVMVEEREAVRVLALCESGQRDEARTAAQRFLRLHPTSPQRARVAGACP